jgi:hypothetical protein
MTLDITIADGISLGTHFKTHSLSVCPPTREANGSANFHRDSRPSSSGGPLCSAVLFRINMRTGTPSCRATRYSGTRPASDHSEPFPLIHRIRSHHLAILLLSIS